jgi:predicted PurR-regulated permease PerM
MFGSSRRGHLKSIEACAIILAVIAGGAAIWALQTVVAPLLFAVFLATIIGGMARRIRDLWPALGRAGTQTLSAIVILSLFGASAWIIISTLVAMLQDAPAYRERFDAVLSQFYADIGMQKPPALSDLVPAASGAGQMVLASLQSLASASVFVVIYVGFILASHKSIARKTRILSADNGAVGETERVIQSIRHNVETFVWIQTLTGGAIAVLSGLILWLFGVEMALFWAFAIFATSYVPIIGGIVGVLLPVAFALAEGMDVTGVLLLLAALSTVQFVIGNIVLPRMAGRDMNVDPIVVLLSLAVWGILLGPVGAVLSTPLTVTAMAICAEFPRSRWLARLLSLDGQLEPPAREAPARRLLAGLVPFGRK